MAHARTIAVLIAAAGRHLFESIHDARVRLVDSSTAGAAPDLVVFPPLTGPALYEISTFT